MKKDERQPTELAQRVEELGKEIQENAQQSREKAERLQKTASTEDFLECSKSHMAEIQAHIEATKLYSEVINEQLKQSVQIQKRTKPT